MIASTEFEKNWQGYLWTIEGSNKLCLINLSEMSKGGCDKIDLRVSMFFKFCGRNPEKSRDQILKIYGEIIIFRVFTAKIAFWWNFIYLSH